MHKKISEMPKEWPLARKGRKYIAVSSHDDRKSIPIVFALRDVLKIAKTRREVKQICLEGNVVVNGKVRKDIAFPIQSRDILQLDKIKKNYVLVQKNKKYKFELIEKKDANSKIIRIIGKTVLGKNKFQANLQDGRNFLVKEKFNCGDSVVWDLNKNQISKIIPLEKGARVEIIKGKHLGLKGKIVGEKEEGNKVSIEIKLEDGKNVFLEKIVLLAIE